MAGTAFWVLVGLTLYQFTWTVADPDLWGHLRFGLDLLETGSLTDRDPYSYVSGGQPWINHEWLAEGILAGLYRAGGPQALIGFKVAIGLVLMVCSAVVLQRSGLHPVRMLMVLALISVPLRMGLSTVRPQLFTYLGFLAILVLIERAGRGRTWWLWLVPMVIAVWVNAHGGVLAGVGILGAWVVGRGLSWAWGGTKTGRGVAQEAVGLVVLMGSGVAALGVNPYGLRLPAFLLRTATVPRPEIWEWSPLPLLSFAGLSYLAMVVLSGVAWLGSRRPRDLGGGLALAASALLPLVSQRHTPLFALAFGVLVGPHLASAWSRWDAWTRVVVDRGQAAIVRFNLLLGSALMILAIRDAGGIRLDPASFPYPTRAVALVRDSGMAGHLAVPFDWGEFAIWYLGPDVQVSVDGRRETVYTASEYRMNLQFEAGSGDWDRLLRTHRTDLVLTRRGSPTANLLSLHPEWEPVYQDRLAVLFLPRGSSLHQEAIGQVPVPDLPVDGAGLMFPSFLEARPLPAPAVVDAGSSGRTRRANMIR
jgi:hypothetical protein